VPVTNRHCIPGTPSHVLVPCIKTHRWTGLPIRIFKDLYYFGKPDPTTPQNEKLDPDPNPHQSQNSGAGRSHWRRGGSVGPRSQNHITLLRRRNRIRIKVKSRIRFRIRIKVKRWIRIRIKIMRIHNPAGGVRNNHKKLHTRKVHPSTSLSQTGVSQFGIEGNLVSFRF
jgi:hypothetical protein